MTKKTKIILIVASIVTLGAIGGIIAYNKRKKKKNQEPEETKKAGTEKQDSPLPPPPPKAPDKLELVEKYTGTKRDSDFVRHYFDDKKYYAMFYNNGRYAIVATGKTGYIQKGNFSEGGRTLIATDGKNKGKTFNASNVDRNLESAIK